VEMGRSSFIYPQITTEGESIKEVKLSGCAVQILKGTIQV